MKKKIETKVDVFTKVLFEIFLWSLDIWELLNQNIREKN